MVYFLCNIFVFPVFILGSNTLINSELCNKITAAAMVSAELYDGNFAGTVDRRTL